MSFENYLYSNVIRKVRPQSTVSNGDENGDEEWDEDFFDYINEYRKYFNLNPNRIGVLIYDYYFDNKSKSLNWEIDAVGYNESDIEVSYIDNRIIIKIKKSEDKESDSVKYFNRGIILEGGELAFDIDINKYDVTKTSVTLEKGLLKVKVPTNKSFVNYLSFKVNPSTNK